jgi:hypothetical protein
MASLISRSFRLETSFSFFPENSDAPKNWGDFPRGSAQAVTKGTKSKIKLGIIYCGIKNTFHQSAMGGEAGMVGVAGRGPMSQEALACGLVRPQESAVFQTGEVLVAGIFTQRIHLRHSAHDA